MWESRVYLRPFAGAGLPARHSGGARVRTAHLLGFLQPLHAVATAALGPTGEVSLVVVDAADWRRLFRYPYGLPFTRNLPGPTAVIVAAADYPERLLRRFDDPLLRAAKAGVRPPGQPTEMLDLMIGHEWGHAVANLSGLRTGVKWLDEFMATYLFVQASRASLPGGSTDSLAAWAAVQAAAVDELRGALDRFEYPRERMQLAQLLWFQGVFTLRALELAPTRGWELATELRRALAAGGAEHRGTVSTALVEVEPSFKAWFAVFGDAEQAAGADARGDECGAA